ncbi:glycosyltransferase family 39 protein [Hymenobacter monticola]|uniref:Glycosyltransferase family 39 protein n=1 Tax=Hymenobacter monticola TaxID=1705399 RepID=A0ABY4B8D6_9BACT|nr:glycosyltransferase family 39 protein [Hymenobacter monticola]UOE35139.1 glycosyltransferase family 39 protein [Hymenobacter monticola]
MITRLRQFWRQHPERITIAALLLTHIAVMCVLFGNVLWHPGAYMLAPGGDGIKNYYALLYYVLYDHGTQFTGMHYPYGELFIYTDGFPLLAWGLKVWKSMFGISGSGVVAAMNLTVLLSSLPASVLVYALLRRSLVGRVFAAGAALAIVFLSPQFLRTTGHFSLALPFVVPLLWYLQVRLSTPGARRGRWWAGYVLAGILLGFLHPYYLLHAFLLPVATAAVLVLQQLGRQRDWWRLPAWLLTAGAAPLLVFQILIALLDSVHDRPTNPYGLLVFRANFASVFGPAVEPFNAAFQFIFKSETAIPEGVSYVGLPVVLALLFWVFRAAGYLLRRRPGRVLRPSLPAPLRATAWAVVPILLFAMAWPFIFEPFAGLPDLLPAIKQFRALGRFAWLFYFVMGVWAAVQYWQLHRLLRQRRLARLGALLLLVVVGIWGMEAKYQLNWVVPMFAHNEVADDFLCVNEGYVDALGQAGRYADNFQAIMPLPYYSVGSEKFGLEPTQTESYESFRASLNLHLPLAATMIPRTGIEQTLHLMELFASDLTPKRWLREVPDARPLLVVASAVDSLRPAETALIRRGGKLLGRYRQVKLYELPLSAFATTRPEQEQKKFTEQQAGLLREGPLWRTQPGAAVVWQSFEQEQAPGAVGFTQPGAAHVDKGVLPLFEGTLPNALPVDSATYELSVWAYAKGKDWLPIINYWQFTPDGQQVAYASELLNQRTEISGSWVRYSTIIHLTNPANRIKVELTGNDVIADDLLIRPRTTNVYWLDSAGHPVLNGIPLVSNTSQAH